MPVIQGDCLEVMASMNDNFVDSIVTDPPAGISFMGKEWDHNKGGRDEWIKWMTGVASECLRVTKPGGHALVWSIPRTSHWTAMAWEDAGWECRDKIVHIFGSGFPKNLDISKQIDKHDGKQMGWFGEWLRKWRCENNITQKEIAILFPSKTGGLTGCVANWELGFNIPTIEQFNLIRDTFNLPFERLEDIEREVVGKRKTGIGTGKGSKPIMGDRNRDVTVPRTDVAKQFSGFGTALKPAHEDWILFRKPLDGTVAQNVLKWGVGGININECRVDTFKPGELEKLKKRADTPRRDFTGGRLYSGSEYTPVIIPSGMSNKGRWPANFIHDGSEEVLELFPENKKPSGKASGPTLGKLGTQGRFGNAKGENMPDPFFYGDVGSAARFFYCAKTSRSERDTGLEESMKNIHPTVKSLNLCRYLCRLITPPGGIILDPFAGSGSTGCAAILEGFSPILIEMESEYVEIAKARIRYWSAHK